MNKIPIRYFAQGIFIVVVMTASIYFIYNDLMETCIGLIRGYDYISFTPLVFPMLFLLPGYALIDLFLFTLLLPFRQRMKIVLEKGAVPFGIYLGVAIFLGFIVSLIVSIYPLSTHYHKCNSTSMISSGSYYARTKEMCQERKGWNAEQRKAAPVRTIQKE